MRCLLATLAGLTCLVAGCASQPQAAAADTEEPIRLGAGDPLGWSVHSRQQAFSRIMMQQASVPPTH